MLLSHVIVHPEACDGQTMLFDYDKALSAIDSFRCVVAVLCGHDHKGGYFCDEKGVHHLTFCSPLNDGTDGAAYGLIDFASDRLELHAKLKDTVPYLSQILPPNDQTLRGSFSAVSASIFASKHSFCSIFRYL